MKFLLSVRITVLFLAGFCLTAGPSLAQEDQQQRPEGRPRRGFGGGGFGGPGGFGGGFGGLGGMGGGSSTMALAANAAVQKDLGLTTEQTEKIKKITDAYQDDQQEANQNNQINFQELQDLSEEERAKKFQEFREKQAAQTKKLTDKYQPKLEKVLEPKQLARIQQIQRQLLGIMALRDKDTVAELGLSKEQQDQIEAIFTEDREKRLLAVLTDEQKAKLEELKGKPFDVSQLRPRFGGGGPGGPGGPGGFGGGGGGGRGGRGGTRERPPM